MKINKITFIIFTIIIYFITTPTPLMGTTGIDVYYNNPLEYKKPSNKSNSNIGKSLLELIKQSKTSIKFAIYGIRNQPEIFNALVEAKNRGVKIFGVVDKDINNVNYYTDTEKFIKKIINVKTDLETDLYTLQHPIDYNYKPFWPLPEGFSGPPQCIGYSLPNNKAIIAVHACKDKLMFKGDIMHNKFFIIDNKTVWTGSSNVSGTGTGGYNANIACIINSNKVANWYEEEFNQMYYNLRFHNSKYPINNSNKLQTKLQDGSDIEILFSPKNNAIENGVRPLLQNAKKSIDISVFYLTHKEITADLIKAFNRGVKIRIIIDATSACNGYTKHEILRAVGIPVKVENWGGKMHMKSAVIDNEYLILGSMNWTSAGGDKNDENTVILRNKEKSYQFTTFFNIIWNSIPDKWLHDQPKAESKESIFSLNDGIDNDFDNLVDSKDNVINFDILPNYKIVVKEDGHDLIKGKKNFHGINTFFLPTDSYYNYITVDVNNGDKWFPSINEAREVGYKKNKNARKKIIHNITSNSNLKNYIGQQVSYKGIIKNIYKNKKICYLNFHTDYKKSPLTCVIFKNKFNNFTNNIKKFYLYKEVVINGKLEEYRGNLQIILNDKSQISF